MKSTALNKTVPYSSISLAPHTLAYVFNNFPLYVPCTMMAVYWVTLEMWSHFHFNHTLRCQTVCVFHVWKASVADCHTPKQSNHGLRRCGHAHHGRRPGPLGSGPLRDAHHQVLPGLGDVAQEEGPDGRPAAETACCAGCKQHLLVHICPDFI